MSFGWNQQSPQQFASNHTEYCGLCWVVRWCQRIALSRVLQMSGICRLVSPRLFGSIQSGYARLYVPVCGSTIHWWRCTVSHSAAPVSWFLVCEHMVRPTLSSLPFGRRDQETYLVAKMHTQKKAQVTMQH